MKRKLFEKKQIKQNQHIACTKLESRKQKQIIQQT